MYNKRAFEERQNYFQQHGPRVKSKVYFYIVYYMGDKVLMVIVFVHILNSHNYNSHQNIIYNLLFLCRRLSSTLGVHHIL